MLFAIAELAILMLPEIGDLDMIKLPCPCLSITLVATIIRTNKAVSVKVIVPIKRIQYIGEL